MAFATMNYLLTKADIHIHVLELTKVDFLSSTRYKMLDTVSVFQTNACGIDIFSVNSGLFDTSMKI